MIEYTQDKNCPLRDCTCNRGDCTFWDHDVNRCAVADALNKYLSRSELNKTGERRTILY